MAPGIPTNRFPGIRILPTVLWPTILHRLSHGPFIFQSPSPIVCASSLAPLETAPPSTMSPLSHITTELKPALGPDCDILVDASGAEFQEYAKRWSDIDRKTPAAILLPTSEEEIQKIVGEAYCWMACGGMLTFDQVKWALRSSVPFVTRSGGHSEWSTIDGSGIIIDLSKYSGIEVDREGRKATLKGSILSKSVAVALAEARLFTGEQYLRHAFVKV
jgi:FAD binding domain